MRQLFIILAAFIAVTSCNNNLGNTTHTNSIDSIPEDSGQVVVLLPVTDSLYYNGCITKIVYPSNRQACKYSLTAYSFNCDGSNLKIHVPCKYLRIAYLQYPEGQIVTIHYPDSSYIRILCGSDADIDIEENKTKGLHHKKVIVKGYQVTYDNVPEEKLQIFNYAFELLKKDIQ